MIVVLWISLPVPVAVFLKMIIEVCIGIKIYPSRAAQTQLPLIIISLPLLIIINVSITLAPPNPFASIQHGLDIASDNDTVLVAAGTYLENINFIGKNIAVQSINGPESTIIDGQQSGTVVSFTTGEDNALLSGFTITGGQSDNGGGVHISYCNPTLENLIISGNNGADGGGMYIKGSEPTIVNVLIEGNSADNWGGASVILTLIIINNGKEIIISGNWVCAAREG